ncbi:hypothetical protein [Legionella shakespearei]|uniref:Uncharacterized protein n=1 Tax=Legionella shakespearei DSM 23087 TaxID=1122169 RepID=A0A0W0YR21_9GAMM|nr:hypothetical protein [Legionella shakespearei]KTD59268.1 hypothetical protein Lsha_1964 [Legionella shakespearei DSM 23087]
MLARGIGIFAGSAAGRRAASTVTSVGEKWAKELSEKAIAWAKTGNAEFPYAARVAGQPVRIRVNDFPEENLLSVVDNEGKAVFHANGMLSNWELPVSSSYKGPK